MDWTDTKKFKFIANMHDACVSGQLDITKKWHGKWEIRWTQRSSPCDLCWYFSNACKFSHKILHKCYRV